MKQIVLFSLLALLSATGSAQTEFYDANYAGDGTVVADFNNAIDVARVTVVRSDGSILSAGQRYLNDEYESIFYCTDASGAPVESFGTNGRVVIDLGGTTEEIFAMILQDDGKILVAGHAANGSYSSAMVARLNEDGTLDDSFGGYGVISLDMGDANDFAYALAVSDDGILIGGEAWTGFSSQAFIVRLTTDGDQDTSWSTDGIQFIDIPDTRESTRALAILEDGSTYACIQRTGVMEAFITVTKLDENGEIDTTWSAEGHSHLNFTADDNIRDAVALADGSLLIAGFAEVQTRDPLLARMLPDGHADADFDTDGYLLLVGLEDAWFNRVALLSTGQIVCAGTTDDLDSENDTDIIVHQFLEDGESDDSFGEGGLVIVDEDGGDDLGYTLAIQSNDQIITGGATSNNSDADVLVVRLIGEITSGLDEAGQDRLILYPNPVVEMLTIDHRSSEAKEAFFLVDQNGRKLLGGTLLPHSLHTVPVAHLPVGTYFIQSASLSERFIKQ